MVGTLYDADIYAWAEQQAAVLREMARTGRDLPNALDLDNLIEEVEALGRAELKSVTGPLRFILVHVVKAASDPGSPAMHHWRALATIWQGDVREAITRAMRARIDLEHLWQRALREAGLWLEAEGARLDPALPAACPFRLEDFLTAEFDFDAAVARLRAAIRRQE